MKRLVGVFVGACLLWGASPAHASNRLSHRFGVSLGILGDPFPTLLGYNASINLARWLRATGGYGQISGTTNAGEAKITTVGGGVRLFVPSWNFSPVVGLSYAKVSFTGSGSLSGFTGNSHHTYATLGFDWQAANGFNFGLGANLSTLSGVGAVPYLNLGWFF